MYLKIKLCVMLMKEVEQTYRHTQIRVTQQQGGLRFNEDLAIHNGGPAA